MLKTYIGIILTGVMLAHAPMAAADVVISNLAGDVFSSTLFGPGSTTVFKAGGWTMPPGQGYFLDDVTLDLTFAGTGTAQVEIWSGVGSPTTPEIILDSPAQGGAGLFAFTPAAPFVMNAGQTYWAYVTAAPNSGNFNWIASTSAPTGIATSAGYIFNGSASAFMNRYEVNGTLVPEPGTLVLLALGMIGLMCRRSGR